MIKGVGLDDIKVGKGGRLARHVDIAPKTDEILNATNDTANQLAEQLQAQQKASAKAKEMAELEAKYGKTPEEISASVDEITREMDEILESSARARGQSPSATTSSPKPQSATDEILERFNERQAENAGRPAPTPGDHNKTADQIRAQAAAEEAAAKAAAKKTAEEAAEKMPEQLKAMEEQIAAQQKQLAKQEELLATQKKALQDQQAKHASELEELKNANAPKTEIDALNAKHIEEINQQRKTISGLEKKYEALEKRTHIDETIKTAKQGGLGSGAQRLARRADEMNTKITAKKAQRDAVQLEIDKIENPQKAAETLREQAAEKATEASNAIERNSKSLRKEAEGLEQQAKALETQAPRPNDPALDSLKNKKDKLDAELDGVKGTDGTVKKQGLIGKRDSVISYLDKKIERGAPSFWQRFNILNPTALKNAWTGKASVVGFDWGNSSRAQFLTSAALALPKKLGRMLGYNPNLTKGHNATIMGTKVSIVSILAVWADNKFNDGRILETAGRVSKQNIPFVSSALKAIGKAGVSVGETALEIKDATADGVANAHIGSLKEEGTVTEEQADMIRQGYRAAFGSSTAALELFVGAGPNADDAKKYLANLEDGLSHDEAREIMMDDIALRASENDYGISGAMAEKAKEKATKEKDKAADAFRQGGYGGGPVIASMGMGGLSSKFGAAIIGWVAQICEMIASTVDKIFNGIKQMISSNDPNLATQNGNRDLTAALAGGALGNDNNLTLGTTPA